MTLAVIPAADPLPLPSPPWLLWSLLMLTWFLHVIAMNFVLGGSIIAAVARVRGTGNGRQLAGSIAKLLPAAVSAAITFGVAPLLFVQALYGRLFFSSAVLMAWWWFAVVPILILAYYGAYVLSLRGQRLGRAATVVGSVVALLFLAISFIYSNNMSLMLRPETFLTKYLQNARGLQLNMGDPTLIPRWLHMVVGAAGVAGMIIAIHGAVQRRKDAEYGSWALRHGLAWFVVATAVNALTGGWWLSMLPREVLLRFMGRSAAGTIWFAAGLILAIGAWSMALAARKSATPEKLIKPAASTLLATLIFMALMRDEVRRGMMSAARFSVADRVAAQWGVIALFALLLIGAVATTIWMVALLWEHRLRTDDRSFDPSREPSSTLDRPEPAACRNGNAV